MQVGAVELISKSSLPEAKKDFTALTTRSPTMPQAIIKKRLLKPSGPRALWGLREKKLL